MSLAYMNIIQGSKMARLKQGDVLEVLMTYNKLRKFNSKR